MVINKSAFMTIIESNKCSSQACLPMKSIITRIKCIINSEKPDKQRANIFQDKKNKGRSSDRGEWIFSFRNILYYSRYIQVIK